LRFSRQVRDNLTSAVHRQEGSRKTTETMTEQEPITGEVLYRATLNLEEEAMHSTPTGPPLSHHNSQPSTPGSTVLGWLLVCFSLIPLAMAASGDSRAGVWIGAALLLVGFLMVVVGKHKRHAS